MKELCDICGKFKFAIQLYKHQNGKYYCQECKEEFIKNQRKQKND